MSKDVQGERIQLAAATRQDGHTTMGIWVMFLTRLRLEDQNWGAFRLVSSFPWAWERKLCAKDTWECFYILPLCAREWLAMGKMGTYFVHTQFLYYILHVWDVWNYSLWLGSLSYLLSTNYIYKYIISSLLSTIHNFCCNEQIVSVVVEP